MIIQRIIVAGYLLIALSGIAFSIYHYWPDTKGYEHFSLKKAQNLTDVSHARKTKS